MNRQTSQGLRTVLLVYAVYWILFDLLHVVSLVVVGSKERAIEGVLVAAVFVFALGSGLASRESAWDSIRIVVVMQLAWTILYTLAMAWGIVSGGLTPDAWPPTIIGAVFVTLLATVYIREHRMAA